MEAPLSQNVLDNDRAGPSGLQQGRMQPTQSIDGNESDDPVHDETIGNYVYNKFHDKKPDYLRFMGCYYESDTSKVGVEPKWIPDANLLEIPEFTLEELKERLQLTPVDLLVEFPTIGEKLQLINWVAHARDQLLRDALEKASVDLPVVGDVATNNADQKYRDMIEAFFAEMKGRKDEVKEYVVSEQSLLSGNPIPM